jgi:hypothetical protein
MTDRDAGALYDVLSDGKRRFAWIEGDSIMAVSYFDERPEPPNVPEGRTWLPVKHVDSEPFNSTRHWRGKPIVTHREGAGEAQACSGGNCPDD